MDILLVSAFRLHDWASIMLAQHFVLVKKSILVMAHLALFGIFFPEFRKSFGSAAEIMLLVILFLSPVSKILGMRLLLQVMGLRRELGIMMGYLATVHSLSYFINPDWAQSIIILFQETGISGASAPYFLGMVAYAATLPLLFTSNALAQRSLGGIRWKSLHRTVYVILPLVLLHHFSIRRGITAGAVVQMVLITALYIMLKVLAWKNVLPPLTQVITVVSDRYRAYTLTQKSSVHVDV